HRGRDQHEQQHDQGHHDAVPPGPAAALALPALPPRAVVDPAGAVPAGAAPAPAGRPAALGRGPPGGRPPGPAPPPAPPPPPPVPVPAGVGGSAPGRPVQLLDLVVPAVVTAPEDSGAVGVVRPVRHRSARPSRSQDRPDASVHPIRLGSWYSGSIPPPFGPFP